MRHSTSLHVACWPAGVVRWYSVFLRPTARAAAGMMRPVIGHTRTGRVAVIRALWDVQTRLVAVVIAASVVHTALQRVIPQGPGPARLTVLPRLRTSTADA